MKNSTYKNLLKIFKSKGVLAASGGLLLISCGAQMGGYTETDGVYYDPNKDVIPVSVTIQDDNVVGEDYSYTDNSTSIIEQNQQNLQAQKNKYQDWNNTSQSDWGQFAGTETNYNSWGWNGGMWGWGNPWGMGFGWNSWNWGLGWNSWYPGWSMGWNGGFGWGWNAGWNWGYPWYGYNPYWDPFWGGYYPGWGAGYPGYWGRPANFKRSGADSIVRNNNSFNNNGNRNGFTRPAPSNNTNNQNSINNSGFRKTGFGTPNSNRPSNNQTQPNRSFRRTENNTPSQQPSYSPPRNDGFRNSGGFGGGSSSGGGMRSSGGGGGFRSGGFR